MPAIGIALFAATIVALFVALLLLKQTDRWSRRNFLIAYGLATVTSLLAGALVVEFESKGLVLLVSYAVIWLSFGAMTMVRW